MPAKSPSRRTVETSRNGNQRSSANSKSAEYPQDFQALTEGVFNAVEDYSRRHPAAIATAVFFLGFYVGWKVKPW